MGLRQTALPAQAVDQGVEGEDVGLVALLLHPLDHLQRLPCPPFLAQAPHQDVVTGAIQAQALGVHLPQDLPHVFPLVASAEAVQQDRVGDGVGAAALPLHLAEQPGGRAQVPGSAEAVDQDVVGEDIGIASTVDHPIVEDVLCFGESSLHRVAVDHGVEQDRIGGGDLAQQGSRLVHLARPA